MMSHSKNGTATRATGGMFLVMVGLGMAFLLFTAVLNVIKANTGPRC